MGKKAKIRKSIHLRGFDYTDSEYVYFVTICTADKESYFADFAIAGIIEKELEFRRTVLKEISLYCYCIMPDHLHILLSLSHDYKKGLQEFISAFKRYTSRSVNELFNIESLWQRNFYEHVVRKEESLLKIAEYIINNPVRKGLVTEWDRYQYSKFVDPLPV